MQKTTAKTIGLTHGYTTQRRQQTRRNANAFLSKPCNAFEMPPEKRKPRTAGTERGNVKKHARFDEEIIARYPFPLRVVIYAVAALTLSGVLPMAIATIQIWLGDTYGIWAYLMCFAADAALIVWLVKCHA